MFYLSLPLYIYLGTIQIPENNAEIIKIRLKVEDIFLQVSYDYLVKIKPKALNKAKHWPGLEGKIEQPFPPPKLPRHLQPPKLP